MSTTARCAPAITVPRPRLLRRTPLRFVRTRARGGGAHRGLNAALVPLCDALLCVVFFLLTFFVAPENCPHRARVPSAVHVRENVEAPRVVVTREQVLLDGIPVADAATFAGAQAPIPIEPLHVVLKAKRELWRSVNPGAPFPGVVVLDVDGRTPAQVVKSVFQTAVRAGYPNVSFGVWRRSIGSR